MQYCTRTAGALLVLAVSLGHAAAQDVKISDRTYVRHDGGTDAAMAGCSVNNRQQNEPAVSVAPHDSNLMTAGANDYCGAPTFGGMWAGFYYSSDRGATWTNSLLPGYPGDTSIEGQQSPLMGVVQNAGDPVQAWDNEGHLYFAGIAFNFDRPANGSLWVARYQWDSGAAPDYQFTTIAARGTPSPIFRGTFHDKIQMEVDRGVDSPYAGNVYVCWARFTASGPNNGVFLVRSTDGGASFSNPQKLSESIHGSQFCDIAVSRDGTVYVAWRQYAFSADRGQQQRDAVAWVKSTDGGARFGKPALAAEFAGWDPGDQYGDPQAAGRAKYEACHRADATPGSCASPEPRVFARDCGDGPIACQSGYVFTRLGTQVRITADPMAQGDPDEVYVVYEASVPGTETATGNSYGTIAPGIASQASVYLIRTTDGGATWSLPARIDPQPRGHQFFPDIDANAGRLHVVYHDSRFDSATDLSGNWTTVPVSNAQTSANPPGSVSSGPGLDTFYATSVDGGASWSATRVSSVSQMPQFEQFSGRDVPFFGDYNYIAASGSTVVMTWTDNRDTVAGVDPRYSGDGTDGFDVFQCRAAQPDGTFGPDTCPNAGGLDQNIYGAVVVQ